MSRRRRWQLTLIHFACNLTVGVFLTMILSRLKTASAILLLLVAAGCPAVPLPAAEPAKGLNATTFAQLQKQIKPQHGESRWMEIPWLVDLHAARQKAAAEGKPLFIYSSGGATGIGAC